MTTDIFGKKGNRILVISVQGIGNNLMFQPTIRALHRTFPDTPIDILCAPNGSDQILRNDPNVNGVIICESFIKTVIHLKRNKYDVAITAYPSGLRSALLSLFSGARIRVGHNTRLLRGIGAVFYTHLVKEDQGIHDVDQNFNIIKLFGNIREYDRPYSLIIFERDFDQAKEALLKEGVADKEEYIIFHPGSNTKHLSKRWNVENYMQLAKRITSSIKVKVVVVGNKNEISLGKEIFSANSRNVINMARKLTLMQTAVLIKMSKLFIGNDSGLMHIAAAVRTPVVAIFGPTDHKEIGPIGEKCLIISKSLKCQPCYTRDRLDMNSCKNKTRYECMKSISVEDVLCAIESQMGIAG